MVHQCLVLFAILFSGHSLAQDERYYRQMLTGELPHLSTDIKEMAVKPISLDGPFYNFDLNGDGIDERLQPIKRDGVDWLIISDSSKRKIFEAKLLAMGGESFIYKLKLVHLSPQYKSLIVFLDEGHTAGKQFESTGKLYVLSFDNNDLSTLSLSPGPHFFHEKESQREQYLRRGYQVTVADLNGDGVREITVHYNHIQRILQYQGKGEWKRY